MGCTCKVCGQLFEQNWEVAVHARKVHPKAPGTKKSRSATPDIEPATIIPFPVSGQRSQEIILRGLELLEGGKTKEQVVSILRNEFKLTPLHAYSYLLLAVK